MKPQCPVDRCGGGGNHPVVPSSGGWVHDCSHDDVCVCTTRQKGHPESTPQLLQRREPVWLHGFIL
ncbi:hypothetical protein INR49_031070 [Caranx melampygus]|nr:hypothetical protein INR49_031070 [Caranx melampygus]